MRRSKFLSVFVAVFILLSTLVTAPASAIVGGDDATLTRTWIAALLYADGSQHCAGSLYKRQWVITSASCIPNSPDVLPVVAVRIGSNDRSSGGTVISVAKRIQHPSFDPNIANPNRSPFDDIGLIKLAALAPVANLPVALATSSGSYWDYKRLRLLGWGQTCGQSLGCNDGSRMLQVLNGVESVPTADCNFTKFRYSTELCLSSTEDRTACYGDGGGPVTNPLLGTLVGVISRGDLGDELSCGSKDTFATRISEYKSWFDVTIANNP